MHVAKQDLERAERERAIEEIEAQLVSGSKWYEKGEVTAVGRPKNSLLTAREVGCPKRRRLAKTGTESGKDARAGQEHESQDEEQAAEPLEFARNKMACKWTEEHVREMEKLIRERVRERRYDNLKAVRQRRALEQVKEEKAAIKAEERKALHSEFEGKVSRNDGFVEKDEIIRLFNEIDTELCALSDHTYVSTELARAADTRPAESRETGVGTCTREFHERRAV